jgi:ketosteroid isomerase-like protein
MATTIIELSDRHEIWQVMLRYARGIDRFDPAMVRSCYHDDAIDDHGVFVGPPDAFVEWAIGYHGTYNTVHHHSLSNHWCELDGETAHAETYYTFIAANRDGPHALAMGRYVDRLEKRHGEWRIADRVCVNELVCDLVATALPDDYARALFSSGPGTRDTGDISFMRPLRARRPTETT